MALPTSLRDYEELYALTPADKEFVAAHRTNANRLGVAVQLCFLRRPGREWTPEEIILEAMTMLTDEALEMHERFLGQQFKKVERQHL